MKIDRLVLGAYQTNCFVLRSGEDSGDCLIIDTGLDAEPLIDFLHHNSLKPRAVVLTHGHIDHIAGVELLRKNFPGIETCIHKLDADMLTGRCDNLSGLTGRIFAAEPAERLLEEGDIINKAGIQLKVLHTPGHTPGGISLYCRHQGVVFSGDSLFAESVGRTDFPCGNLSQLLESIKEKLLTLPGQTIVYPGHGPTTSIAHEKAHNPFLK